MPAIKCDNNKWKWGESGECVYESQEEAEQDNQDYRDMTNLNSAGYDNAVSLIKEGKYNTDKDWEFTAADGNELLGDEDWGNYAKWFLAYDSDVEEDTKSRFGYPFGKNGEVFRESLIATRQYAGRFKLDSIFDAAGELLEMIDNKEAGNDIHEKRHIISIVEDEKTVTIVYEKDLGDEDYHDEEIQDEPVEEIITEEPQEEIEEDTQRKFKIWDKKYNNITMEKRVYNIETRVEEREDGKEVVIGHASVYDSRSNNLGGFYEYIAKGAFTDDLIKKSDVRALINHDPNLVLARNTSGTLKLEADEKGLRYEFEIPQTSYGKDLAINMKNGNISQSSFAFTVQKDEWSSDDEGNDIRTITAIDRLYDISAVTYPAYSAAESDLVVAQRGLAMYKEKLEKQEEENDLVKRSLAQLKIEIIKRKK